METVSLLLKHCVHRKSGAVSQWRGIPSKAGSLSRKCHENQAVPSLREFMEGLSYFSLLSLSLQAVTAESCNLRKIGRCSDSKLEVHSVDIEDFCRADMKRQILYCLRRYVNHYRCALVSNFERSIVSSCQQRGVVYGICRIFYIQRDRYTTVCLPALLCRCSTRFYAGNIEKH